MKKLFLFLSVLLLIAVVTPTQVQAQKTVVQQLIVDSTMTNAVQTCTVAYGPISHDAWVSVQTVCDSLTGTPAGYVFLEQSNSPAGTKWNMVDTLATLGVGGGIIYGGIYEFTSGFLGSNLRVRCANTGTHTTKINVWLALKKKTQ